jgi:hypothetical protein
MGSGGITNGKTREYRVVQTLHCQAAIETISGNLWQSRRTNSGGG